MVRPWLLASANETEVALVAVIVLGIAAMWLGQKLKVPSILLLLGTGVLAGPGVGLIDPDELLGDLLFPAVSLAVGVLLFEGGLGLRYRELEKGRREPILRLVTVGVLVTWVIGAASVYLLFDLSRSNAVLLGSILVVSGPTVVLPLLTFARVREPVNGILKWEGIFIDPVGATLAIVVLEAVIGSDGAFDGALRVGQTAGAGTLAGFVGAGLLMLMFRRHWVPDNLHNPFTLMMMVLAYGSANMVRPEAGLFAATVMGVVLANQQWVPVSHIREFEENLGSLILAALFVILGARVDLEAVSDVLVGSLILVAILVLVARPIAVYLSTVGSVMSIRERVYLACMAPRGIVAAAVSAIFALELTEAGRPVDALVPVTFVVIVGTVSVYGLGARAVGRLLHVARPEPHGLALIGGPAWALDLADTLHGQDVPVLLVTNDAVEAAEATERGLLVFRGRLDSEELSETLENVGIAQAVALSRYTELNAYGIARVLDTVGRANVFYLPPRDVEDEKNTEPEMLARRPFGKGVTQDVIDLALLQGGGIEVVDRDSFDAEEMKDWLPLVRVVDGGAPSVEVSAKANRPVEGSTLIMLRRPRGSSDEDDQLAASDSSGSSSEYNHSSSKDSSSSPDTRSASSVKSSLEPD